MMAIPIEAYGDPDPTIRPDKSRGELRAMSNAELADYIERGTSDDDGTSPSVRMALVRVLRDRVGQPRPNREAPNG